MKHVAKGVVIAGISFLVFSSVQAQQGYKWMVGVNAGAMIYQGDLTPSALGSYQTPSFTIGVNAARILNAYFAVRVNAAFGRIRGNDAAYKQPAWRQYRNFNFTSPVTEFSAQLVWNPYGNNSHETGQRFTPYLFGGLGAGFIRVSRDYSQLDTTAFGFSSKQQSGLRIDSAVSPPRSLLVIPVGAGCSYALGSRWSLHYEIGFRYTFSDYVDGFSQAANPSSKDYYHTQTLGLMYRFGGNGGGSDKLGCPVMKF